MANAFGLVLDSASVRRAAVEGVPETVIGTIYLLHENSVDDISSKLTPHELGHVIRLVGRCPGCYPPGTLAALKSVRLTRLPDPSAVSISTDQARSRLAARTSAERLHRHRPHARKRVGRPFEHSGSATAAAMHISGMPNPYGIKLDDASIRWATAERVSETIIAAVLLLHEKSVDEVAAKLRPDELAHVVRFVSRCPSCYPHGTLAALRSLRPVSERPSVSTSNHQPPSRRPGRIIAKGLHTSAQAPRFGHPQRKGLHTPAHALRFGFGHQQSTASPPSTAAPKWPICACKMRHGGSPATSPSCLGC